MASHVCNKRHAPPKPHLQGQRFATTNCASRTIKKIKAPASGFVEITLDPMDDPLDPVGPWDPDKVWDSWDEIHDVFE